MLDTLTIVHAAATWFMAGLIWFVQVVHYPLFAAVGAREFAAYERRHQRRTTLVVGPVMLVEAASAVGLAVLLAPGPLRVAAWVGAAMLAVVWVSTFAVQVPLHGRLGAGLDSTLVRRLVLSNWVRTVLWTGRGVIAGWLVVGG